MSFTVKNIPGLVLWLDAADPYANGSNASSGTLGTWNDKSGKGYNCTITSGANAPTYSASTKTFQFRSSSSQSFDIAQGFGDSLVNKNYTVFVVGTRKTTGYQYFLSGATTGTYQNLFVGYRNSTMLENNLYAAEFTANVPAFAAGESARIISYSSFASYRDIVVNGVVSGTGVAANITSFLTPRVGRRYDGGATTYHDVDVNELIAFVPALTTSQRQQVEGYLAWKWGLAAQLLNNHPYKYLSPNGITFTPTVIPSCQLWLDASDSAMVVTSGGNVTQWKDKTSNNNHYTAVGTLTYSNNGINFNNSAYLNNSTMTNFAFGNKTPITTFIVFKVSDVASTHGIFSYGTVGSSNNGYVIYTDTDSKLYGTSYHGNFNTNTSISTNTMYIASDQAYYNDSAGNFTRYGWVNGTANSVTASNVVTLNITTNDSNVGRTGANQPFVGQIYEVIYYTRNLSTSERQLVEGYLAWKWNMVPSLSATHPYKFFPIVPNYLNNLLTNSSIWLDAADTLAVNANSNGSSVTNWFDKSINNNDAIKYLTNAVPTYNTTALNNAGGLTFNGTSQFLALTNPLQPGTAMTLFAVGNNNINRNFLTASTPTGNHPAYYVAFKNDLNFSINSTADIPYITNNSSTAINTNYVLTGVFDGSTVTSLINGGALSNSTAFSGTAKTAITTFLGSNWNNGTINVYFGGVINEFIVFNTVITTSQRQLIEGYLAWKWGLQSGLPTSHAYKTSSPANIPSSIVLTNYTTDPNVVTNYVLTTSDTPDTALLNLKSALKSSALVDASKNDVKIQYINSLISKNGSNIVNVPNSADFFANSISVQSGLASKNVKVMLPTISGSTGSISFPITDASNYYHIEMPTNTTITLSGVTPAVSLSYNGTTVSYNGQNKVVGDTITINSKTYKIVALGSVTLDSQSAGVGGDPHVYPLIGKSYDLPNVKGDFLLFDNDREDNLKLICFCDFLTPQEVGDSKFKTKSVTEGTFITKLIIKHNEEIVEIDMKNLNIIDQSGNFDINEIYEDTLIFKKFYSNMTIFKYNINFNGSSRNIKINTESGEYNIKISLDLNCADHRNHVQIFGPDLASCKGALIYEMNDYDL